MRNQTTTTNFCDVCKEIIIFLFQINGSTGKRFLRNAIDDFAFYDIVLCERGREKYREDYGK